MLRLADSLDMISRLTASVIRWLALVMVLVQFGIVVGRYVFGYNIIAVQESVLYMHAALFMLGAGYTLLVDKHVRVDVFYAKAEPRTQRRIDVFGHVFLLIPSMLVMPTGPGPRCAIPGRSSKVRFLSAASRRCS